MRHSEPLTPAVEQNDTRKDKVIGSRVKLTGMPSHTPALPTVTSAPFLWYSVLVGDGRLSSSHRTNSPDLGLFSRLSLARCTLSGGKGPLAGHHNVWPMVTNLNEVTTDVVSQLLVGVAFSHCTSGGVGATGDQRGFSILLCTCAMPKYCGCSSVQIPREFLKLSVPGPHPGDLGQDRNLDRLKSGCGQVECL